MYFFQHYHIHGNKWNNWNSCLTDKFCFSVMLVSLLEFSDSASTEITNLGFHNWNKVDLIEADSGETKRILRVILNDKKKSDSIQLQKVNGPLGWDLNTTGRQSNYHLTKTQRKWHFWVSSHRLTSPNQVSNRKRCRHSRAFLITYEKVLGATVRSWNRFQKVLLLLRGNPGIGIVTQVMSGETRQKHLQKVFSTFKYFS